MQYLLTLQSCHRISFVLDFPFAMQTVSVACLFLAGKVEESPKALRDVCIMCYQLRHKKDPNAVSQLKAKDVRHLLSSLLDSWVYHEACSYWVTSQPLSLTTAANVSFF